MRVKTGAAMIMGCSFKNANNGKTYYNVDIYDSVSGNMYRCSAQPEVYSMVENVAKPLQVKSIELDVLPPWQGASRLEVLSWS